MKRRDILLRMNRFKAKNPATLLNVFTAYKWPPVEIFDLEEKIVMHCFAVTREQLTGYGEG